MNNILGQVTVQADELTEPVRAKQEAKDTVSALERGMAVIRCFTEERRLISATELANLTGIPRPTVTRLATTLVALGLLKQEALSERFKLGPGFVSLARVFLAGLDIREVARPHMQMLAESMGGSVYLAVRDGLEMVLIETCRARSSMLTARLDVGSRIPIMNSALGRAHLLALGVIERNALMDSLRLSYGSDWTRQSDGLERSLADAMKMGFHVSIGEFHREINSVSVPLVGPDGEVYALNCGGAAYAFTEARLREEVGPRLLAMTQTIAGEIGGAVAYGTELQAGHHQEVF